MFDGVPAGKGRLAASENKTSNLENALVDKSTRHTAPASQAESVRVPSTDIRKIMQGNPFYGEATKILHGKLSETDASRRRQILNYCEHLRMAYTTKDIDFLRQVFSDDALIIVGNVVKISKECGRLAWTIV